MPQRRIALRVFAEFVVIVVGVLVAFAVEDWSDDRTDRRVERQYLVSLANDLRGDSARLVDSRIPLSVRAREVLESIAPVARGDVPFPTDTVAFLWEIARSYRTPFPRSGPTYEELLATGSLRLIESDELRTAIVSYYQFNATAALRDETYASRYSEIVRSDLPDPGLGEGNRMEAAQWEAALRRFGIERAVAAVTSPAFASAVNRHINYWVIMAPTLDETLHLVSELIVQVEAAITN